MEKEKKDTIQIHYQKNPLYRTVHCDGAVGGMTPLGDINITFYSTRSPIPKSVHYELLKDGGLGKLVEMSAETKRGVIREIEFGVYMNEQRAKDLYNFLKKMFDQK